MRCPLPAFAVLASLSLVGCANGAASSIAPVAMKRASAEVVKPPVGESPQLLAKRTLSLDGARRAVASAVAEARRLGTTGVVAVVDDGGNLMAVERIDGTFAAGANISIGKARTAALFKRPTRAFEELIKGGRTPMIALHDFTPLQGGVPIVVDGQIVGGIGVSGAASAQQDEELAIAGASGLVDVVPSRNAPTAFIGHDEVAAAFAKGRPLLEQENYKIHASRREGPGMAEVHVQDTDIIYVTDGSATFVTGGSVVDGKTVEQDEIRGARISGGKTAKLVKGDVAVVPRGVPHWFEEVQGPFTYYVVKVR